MILGNTDGFARCKACHYGCKGHALCLCGFLVSRLRRARLGSEMPISPNRLPNVH
jgi:hypothetical protein